MGTAYYNENDKFPAQWLRNLSAAELIAQGVVDERSIKDVASEDVRGATQAHFFAGVGVWSYALRLAGWPDDLPIWTGSCPCQPFSQAGAGQGTDDDRHLWPDWFKLIKKCRPPVIFGEQVSSPDGLGWLDTVQADLEGAGYAFAAIDSCSAGVGAPHIRQRLYFVAYAEEFRWPEGWHGRSRDGLDEAWKQFERHGDARELADTYLARFARQSGSGSVLGAEAEIATGLERADRAQLGGATDELADSVWSGRAERGTGPGSGSSTGSSGADELADADRERLEGERLLVRKRGPLEDLPEAPRSGEVVGVADSDGGGLGAGLGSVRTRELDDGGCREARGVGDAGSERSGRDTGAVPGTEREGGGFSTGRFAHLPVVAGAATELVGDTERAGLQEQLRERGLLPAQGGDGARQAVGRAGSPTGGFWTDAVWLHCRDGKHRPVEPRLVALSDGTPVCLDFVRPLEVGVEGRIGKIKAFGNAINGLQAAVFIRSFIEADTPSCSQHLCG